MKGNFIFHCCVWSFCLISSTEALPSSQGFDLNLYHFLKTPKITPVDLNSVCIYNEIVYLPNENFTTGNPCEICVCNPPGYTCTLKSCDIKPGCKSLQIANKCCPEYLCECEINGKLYGNGEKVEEPNPCKVCYCKGGEIKCALITCYTRNDCEPVYVDGRCCPKYDNCPPLEMKNNSESFKPTPVVISDLTPSRLKNGSNIDKTKPEYIGENGLSTEYIMNNYQTDVNNQSETVSEKQITFSSSFTTLNFQNISTTHENSESFEKFSTTKAEVTAYTTNSVELSNPDFYYENPEELETNSSDLQGDGNESSNQMFNFSHTNIIEADKETFSQSNTTTEEMLEVKKVSVWETKTNKSQKLDLNVVMETTTTLEPDTSTVISSENMMTQEIDTKIPLDNDQVTEEFITENSTEVISLENQETTTNVEGLTLYLNQSNDFIQKPTESEILPVDTNETSIEETNSQEIVDDVLENQRKTESLKPVLDENQTFFLNFSADTNAVEEFTAPGLKMLSAEQIQFLHVGEEPPVYVSPVSATTTEFKAETQPDFFVFPNTTPATVEMTKVIETKNLSNSN